jgi:hypothetical protein
VLLFRSSRLRVLYQQTFFGRLSLLLSLSLSLLLSSLVARILALLVVYMFVHGRKKIKRGTHGSAATGPSSSLSKVYLDVSNIFT